MSEFESLTIERSMGATYNHREKWAVYRHSTYARGSVLEGAPKRTFVAEYDTVMEAQRDYPEAEIIDGTTYIPIDQMTAHLPDDDDERDYDPFWDNEEY